MQIKVAARGSKLSRVQVKEVMQELMSLGKDCIFDEMFVETMGDLDQQTSLMQMDKTNFFTKEVDELVLSGMCDVGIHSAKDLPDPLPKGLEIFAITKGKDPRDALVFKEGVTLETLKKSSPKVGTSSQRRIEMIKVLAPNAKFVDIRGKIEQRLELLKDGNVDALVIAEAALIRLGLTHINRAILDAEAAPLQGRLAIVGRAQDADLKQFFQTLNA